MLNMPEEVATAHAEMGAQVGWWRSSDGLRRHISDGLGCAGHGDTWEAALGELRDRRIERQIREGQARRNELRAHYLRGMKLGLAGGLVVALSAACIWTALRLWR